MSEVKLSYLSVKNLSALTENIEDNIDHYKTNGFAELTTKSGWSIPTEVEADFSEFVNLIPNSGMENEVHNSLIVWRGLYRLPAALATENRVWARLSHVEGFEYSQKRWLDLTKSDDEICKQITDHFFAPSLIRYRDDHAIGRLWWNAYVAKLLRPEDQEGALRLMLQKADVRKNLVERSMTFSRLEVGQALLRLMERTPGIYSHEGSFREFIKIVNKFGGGKLFEALGREDCDVFMNECWERTRIHLNL